MTIVKLLVRALWCLAMKAFYSATAAKIPPFGTYKL